jgi:hypothetical protein
MNMNFRLLISSALTLTLFSLSAQGPYFQQHVAYTINVKLNDQKHELSGNESLVYTNNSPDALSFIWFHIWPNAYKDHSTALAKQLLANGGTEFFYSKSEDRGYIDSLNFSVDGQPAKTEAHPEHIDIIKIILNTPLQPGGKITITTPFHVKVPLGKYSRMGHIGQQYQISQWYPKPAVYDNTGWHEMPYLDQGEFYSEFGSFDVSITVPKNYVLMATGDLPENDPETEWWNKLAEQTLNKNFDEKKYTTSHQKGTVESPAYNDSFPVSSPEWKTLRFRQDKVHDFAWFCDKRYNVLKGQVTLPESKRVVNTWLCFTNGQSKYWKNAIPYINDAIYYYSLWNGDYPYNHATAVDGALSAGGGMEYPNITVIGGANNPFTLETVIMHEVGHNWFYGILGSNERDFGWMDEGLNSFNENRYIETKYPNVKLTGEFGNSRWARLLGLDMALHKEQYYLSYAINARRRLDQPLNIHSARYTTLNYAGIVYSKTAIIFDYLMAYLGTEMMDKCMKTYYKTWQFRHPSPGDFRKIVEEVSGKNLAWLFDDLIQTTKHLDYKITHVRKTGSAYDVTIKNTGEIAGPVGIGLMKDGSIETKWFDGFAPGESKTFNFSGEGYAFRIDPLLDMPEMNRNNNISRTKGLFKKTEPVSLQLIGSLDDPEKSQLFFSPVLGGNAYNGFMLGGVFYNSLLPEKKFDYLIMPMYGFRSKSLAGYYELNLNLHPKKFLQTVRLTQSGKRYAYDFNEAFPFSPHYNKFSNEIYFEFRKKESRSLFTHHLRYRNIWIFKDELKGNYNFQPAIYTWTLDTAMFNDVSFWTSNEHTIHAWNAGLNLEQGKDYMKLSGEFNLSWKFKNKKKELLLRLYAGTFVGTSKEDASRYPFRLAGVTGSQDYLYEYTFLGRSETEGLLSQQFGEKNGAFKVPTTIGSSREWIAAMNIKSPLPYIPFLKIFTDVGYVPGYGIRYDAGVYVSLFNKALEIYYPLLYSEDIKDNLDDLDLKGAKLIRFTLNLDVINPFRAIRNFSDI